MIKPEGIVPIDIPYIQGYHAGPTDYGRFTLNGLKLLCQKYHELEAGVHMGPSSSLMWVMREWFNRVFKNRYLSNLFLILTAVLTVPLKYLEYSLIGNPKVHRMASAVFFRGTKNRLAERKQILCSG